MLSFEIIPIGTVRNDRTDVQHTDNWGAIRSTITIDERFGDLCLQGLEGFSHVKSSSSSISSRTTAITANPVPTAAAPISRRLAYSPAAAPATAISRS